MSARVEPAVSVCIRGWRRETLPRAIESALEQGHDDLEVIVGDESGRVADVVERFEDPRVRYCRFGTLGSTDHARALLQESCGRYVALLDDDDRWLPGFLDAVTAKLDQDPELGVAFTNFHYEVGGRLYSRQWRLGEGRHDSFLPEVLRGCPLILSSALIRRAAWEDGERRHPLRGDTWIDMSTWLRTAAAGWPFFYVDRRLAVYRLHSGQITQDAERMREGMVALWSSFRFDDSQPERLRRRRLAEALFARANLHFRHGRLRAALDDIGSARAADGGRVRERELVALLGLRQTAATTLIRHPRLLGPALVAWRALAPLDRFR